jgi:hypothetical protein
MENDALGYALENLRELDSDDAAVRRLIQSLGSSVKVGDVTGSTGIAIGHDIRLVVNQFNLPTETVAALLDARTALGGLDASRYRLGDFVAAKTEGFVGRDHIFQAITRFLEGHPNGYMTIQADPGLGKSTLLAEYVRRTGCIAHFNVRAQGVVHATQFLEDVCAQIIAEFGLSQAGLPQGATQDGAFLAKLLSDASQKLEPGERLVIAVDALDEVDLGALPLGANILFLPPTLPESVYFIMTRRDVDVPLVVQAPQTTLDLLDYPAENRRDVETYLIRSSERPKIRAWIESQPGMTPAAFVATLADKSENNFMYLRYVLPDIEVGVYHDLQIDSLPVGLRGYYESHWRMMGMMARPLPRLKILIIYILSESLLPVSRRLLAKFLTGSGVEADELAIQDVLDEWHQFLHEQQTPDGARYSIYHDSFRDFLNRRDIVQAAGVTIKGISAQIADSMTAPIEDELEGW